MPTTGSRSTNSTSIPLYLQISESITRDMAAGRYSNGDRLPPERELAEHFGTTVRTLRKALSVLRNQGLLQAVHGSGNYVRLSEQNQSIYSLFRLELPGGGGLPTAQLLEVRDMKKNSTIPSIGTSERATRVRRLRCLDQKAIAIEEIWLDRDSGKIEIDELGDSLYRYYQIKLGFWIHRVEDSVSIQPLPAWTPDSLGNRSGEVFGFVERLSWAQDKNPIEYSRTWFNPEKSRYVQRLK